MKNSALVVLSLLVLLLAAPFQADPGQGDGIDLSVTRYTNPAQLSLSWTGGSPPFEVFRSTLASGVEAPGNKIQETNNYACQDTPPAGLIFFYQVTSACVITGPEVCDGVDNDCDGTADGPLANPSCADWQCCRPPGVCGCPDPTTLCDGTCVDTQANRLHCGGCGIACRAGQICSGGACAATCATGLTNCSGLCRNLMVDSNNCGTCGRTCGPGEICDGGSCLLSCPLNWANCSGLCRNRAIDSNNCGTCGRVCGPGEVCDGGSCLLSCPLNWANCSGLCRNLTVDSNNCGTCGRVCPSNQCCSGGGCVPCS